MPDINHSNSSSILSRTRSAMVSLSSWAKTEAIYIIAFPIGFDISNSSLIQIKEYCDYLDPQLRKKNH